MTNGNVNIEYPYDSNSNQYNLWKPGSGYFPRGEAPPPYEEAIAQTETINAQCTVRLVFYDLHTYIISIITIESDVFIFPYSIISFSIIKCCHYALSTNVNGNNYG